MPSDNGFTVMHQAEIATAARRHGLELRVGGQARTWYTFQTATGLVIAHYFPRFQAAWVRGLGLGGATDWKKALWLATQC